MASVATLVMALPAVGVASDAAAHPASPDIVARVESPSAQLSDCNGLATFDDALTDLEACGPAVVTAVPRRVHPDPNADADARPQQRSAAAPARGTPGPVNGARTPISGFMLSTREPQPIRVGWQPYQDGKVRALPYGLIDTEGVRVFRAPWDGRVYDHPVGQAQYALQLLESYRMTGSTTYLNVAIKNAQRVIDRRHVIDGAWYFPYDFDFDLYRNGRGVLKAPWSSGMASGQALSMFVRLYLATNDSRWREAADLTFAAFRQAPDGRGYFSSWVDSAKMLWLEEYSRYPVTDSERVFNGHMWSMYGLWDYLMLHGFDHPHAEQLWRGALHTVEKTGMRDFRNKDWYSYYSIWQRRIAPTYHQYHQEQFRMLYRMSHDSVWVTRASTYRQDHPEWRTTNFYAVVTPRTTRAYRLDDTANHPADRSMRILQTRTVSLARVSGAWWDRRGRLPNGGPKVIRLRTGFLAGWWIVEEPGKAWSRTPVETHTYLPDVRLYVARPRTLAIYRFDAAGNRTDGKLVTLQPGTTYQSSRSAVIEGRPAWLLAGGTHAGWWLPEQASVLLHRNPGWA